MKAPCPTHSGPFPGDRRVLQGGKVSLPQPALALSPLQTPSADLFHYDSMNAVNWGMRGESQGLRTHCSQCYMTLSE